MPEPKMAPGEFRAATDGILSAVGGVVEGSERVIRSAVVVMLAEGHLLVEDVPGVGKTILARALAASVGADVRRIQFTPDLLPGDITGVSVFNPATREFEFARGAVFSNVVIADEINRASPKTQSALLEAMEERQVSADGHSHALPAPFLVVATQNPLEMDGTYALPEAQLDRFMMRLSMGYPDAEAEALMLRQRETRNPLDDVRSVVGPADVIRMIDFVRHVHVAPAIESYAVSLARATRQHADLVLGASPRATLQLVRAAKASAALDGRGFVVPDDVAALARAVFSHRLIPHAHAGARAAEASERAVAEAVGRVPVPVVGG
ncbi:AAA family ATPase [Microbacterium halophytorum]|uniref:AAA family ATPase n=1 Tax=Microbacterium halophytorum TaxID=2067568 RepID=UPI000CFA8F77|nr:MoxR family ATPase [Microbacterium halophytorum]